MRRRRGSFPGRSRGGADPPFPRVLWRVRLAARRPAAHSVSPLCCAIAYHPFFEAGRRFGHDPTAAGMCRCGTRSSISPSHVTASRAIRWMRCRCRPPDPPAIPSEAPTGAGHPSRCRHGADTAIILRRLGRGSWPSSAVLRLCPVPHRGAGCIAIARHAARRLVPHFGIALSQFSPRPDAWFAALGRIVPSLRLSSSTMPAVLALPALLTPASCTPPCRPAATLLQSPANPMRLGARRGLWSFTRGGTPQHIRIFHLSCPLRLLPRWRTCSTRGPRVFLPIRCCGVFLETRGRLRERAASRSTFRSRQPRTASPSRVCRSLYRRPGALREAAVWQSPHVGTISRGTRTRRLYNPDASPS